MLYIDSHAMKEEKQGRILIVEDNRDTQILLDYLLKPEYVLDIAESVSKAIELTAETQYDLLLVDINLGEERTGVDLLKMLRENSLYDGVPLIAITAYAMPGDYQRFIGMGFDAYISKPFTRLDLINTIKSFLPKRIV